MPNSSSRRYISWGSMAVARSAPPVTSAHTHGVAVREMPSSRRKVPRNGAARARIQVTKVETLRELARGSYSLAD